MTVAGVELSEFTDTLRKVPAHRDRNPVAAIDVLARVGQPVIDYMREHYDAATVENLRHLSLNAFTRLGLDEIAKIRFSTIFMMHQTVEDEFKNNSRFVIVNKIANSMWRWGMGRSGWNELVDGYEGIRNFSFEHPDFEVRLDHTTGHNECGYSEHSRTFLDGVFAFLVYYRGEHVMTLGFSLMNNRRLLIQQVQLAKQRGNRFLFKLPKNRMEHVIGLFRKYFPRHRLYVVDGHDVATKSLKSYRNAIRREQERAERARQHHPRCHTKRERDWCEGDIQYAVEAVETFTKKAEHLEGEVDRLAAFYRDTGVFKLGAALKSNGLTHYEVSYDA